MSTAETVIVHDRDADDFHRRVLSLESRGYRARRESYSVTAETNQVTGEIIRLYSIELSRVTPDEFPPRTT